MAQGLVPAGAPEFAPPLPQGPGRKHRPRPPGRPTDAAIRDIRDAAMLHLAGAGFAVPAMVTLQVRDVAPDGGRVRGIDVGAEAARSLRVWIRDGRRWWARAGTVALFVGMHGGAVCYATAQYALARVRHRRIPPDRTLPRSSG